LHDPIPLIEFVLLSSPETAGMARHHVRAALEYHQLEDYADDAEIVASELVTNAIEHGTRESTQVIGLALVCSDDSSTVAVVVTDPSPDLPVIREATDSAAERGRGLHIVEALSARWGWRPKDPGKAVFAILTREA
jgi:anti-sigma regulatory factor (Ser/Thr protein kinase)